MKETFSFWTTRTPRLCRKAITLLLCTLTKSSSHRLPWAPCKLLSHAHKLPNNLNAPCELRCSQLQGVLSCVLRHFLVDRSSESNWCHLEPVPESTEGECREAAEKSTPTLGPHSKIGHQALYCESFRRSFQKSNEFGLGARQSHGRLRRWLATPCYGTDPSPQTPAARNDSHRDTRRHTHTNEHHTVEK